ncbi:Protein kinase-like domain protein [Beauveria brongniartii RCEF 3172]|uniref:Protein kinase-like domain protein n=1 Tax=Beauveria brongniartii RCEF 3172 TaxID=1081107 RepID=A0A162M512_9HYPO|nr:Protein kinase-like domain protein [Beauveria brongniartii RCEF 3172]
MRQALYSLLAAPASEGHNSTTTSAPLENRLIHLLREAEVASEQESNDTFDDDNYEDGWKKHEILQEKVEKVILRLAGPLFDKKAPPVKTLPNGLILQDLVWYQKIHFRLQTIDGKPQVFEIGPDQAACAPKTERQPRVDEAFKPDPRFPIYSAAGLQVLREAKGGGNPVCKVRAIGNGEIMMSKTPQNGLGCDELKREMAALVTIRDTEDRVKIKIATPRLLGYVAHAETGVIIGFLREWVESSRLGATLDSIYMGNIDLDTRQKWADQIEETMSDLHDIGLFWGDCKPANIIVDEKQKLWLIDLGGSFTQLWVDKELTGTLEGDNQGLLNIQKFLGVVERDGKKFWGHYHHF